MNPSFSSLLEYLNHLEASLNHTLIGPGNDFSKKVMMITLSNTGVHYLSLNCYILITALVSSGTLKTLI